MRGPVDDEQARVLISLVIPVFNLEGYLDECLESITRQAFRDIEIVAVNGGSSDASGQIMESWCQKEPRLTALHAARIGPGLARNLGYAAAKGEYIWFVDGDDTIVPGCLEAIAARIEETHPDVLLIGCQAVYPDGRSQSSIEYDLVGMDRTECFTLAEQPSVLHLTMTCWNKIIRREFFDSIGTRFSPDWPHEDVPVSGLLLLRAARLDTLNQICYRYRVNRSGSALTTSAAHGHFRIFTSYETIMGHVEAHAEAADPGVTNAVRQSLFDRAIWHYIMILDDRLGRAADKSERRNFFDRMHHYFVRHVPPGYRHSSGFRGLKVRLVERNAYLSYLIISPLIKRLRTSRS